MRLRLSVVVPTLLAIGAAVFYLSGLHTAPLTDDEMFAALTAKSVATTGRDLNGQLLPLYFQMALPFNNSVWFQPFLIYALSAILAALPFSEGTIRIPMAVLGVLDVVLMYLVGRQLFRRTWLAVGAAALLGMTPAHLAYSRTAYDFQALLPFILGWLLCLLIYIRTGARRWAFGAGLTLGVGLFTYLAAYLLMPIFLLFTIGVLYRRASSRDGVLSAIGGFVLPASLAGMFLLSHVTAGRNLYGHYQHEEGLRSPGPSAAPYAALLHRAREVATVYGSFVTPRLLFVHGRQSLALGGLFLVPIAGLLVAAGLRLIRRPTPEILLIAGGLICAPLPAVFVPQVDAIHRALAMMPFGILLGMMGLEFVSSGPQRLSTLAFGVLWAAIIAVAVIYQRELPQAQAMVRAASVPLAVAGLSALTRVFTAGRRQRWDQIGLAAVTTLLAMEIAYRLVGDVAAIRGSILLLTVLGVAPLLPVTIARVSRPMLFGVVLLAAASSLFTHLYLEPAAAMSIAFIPRSVMLLAIPLGTAAVLCAGLVALLGWPTAREPNRGSTLRALVLLSLTVVIYFHVDRFPQVVGRGVVLAVVLLGVGGVARLHKDAVIGHLTSVQIAATVVFTIAVIQFGYFATGYFQTSGRHEQTDIDSESLALSAMFERAHDRTAPALYLANLGPYSEMHWRFYAIKNNRADLVAPTVVNPRFNPDDLGDLPAGSLAVVGRSNNDDPSAEPDTIAIARIAAEDHFAVESVHASDGSLLFWVLERVAR